MKDSKLQQKPSALKRENPDLQNMKFRHCFFFVCVIFASLAFDQDSADQNHLDPDR